MRYVLNVSYKPTKTMQDDLLEKVVGRKITGSGYLFTTQTRDVDFEFARVDAANRCKDMLRKRFTRKVTRVRVIDLGPETTMRRS
jgi:hypothetical protein